MILRSHDAVLHPGLRTEATWVKFGAALER